MFKKTLSGLVLTASAAANASQYDMSNHIEFSYTPDCLSGYCETTTLYSFEPQNPRYAMGLDSDDPLNLDAGLQPKHLIVLKDKDWDYLMGQTYTILGLSVATVGLMTLLPESITKWDDEDRDMSKLGSKWKDNVSSGPVWDRDEHFLNYVMHPYFGGVYYTASRHAGYNEFESFLYSATMSAFFWEYGVEAFAEVPSWQDLFITPFFGAVVGEMMLTAEQDIIAGGGEVMGSETMGDVSLFFLNPIGHIHYWISDAWGGSAEFQFSSSPWFGNQDAAKFAMDSGASYDNVFYGFEMKVTF
ncbi:DUF3943 domain-containing protein [Vibrio campbellii]|uniref:DUF3943 domain-containing protein n=1 Tax=Vibrio campbellii TaxID=680 RepID=A0ABY5IHP0_9VIBR|nr:DUF3943 domain-containing protein [Vibrio campbellii]UTZ23120.1 DUF3943 domain-containing protein [Vibrio campbellii]UTZ32773.1 DUF3943 domain-containing protein [Vibrio campbellii]